MPAEQPSHEGGCLCGAVRYRASGPLRDVVFCHCSQCRKQTGLYFATTTVPQTHFELLASASLRWFGASDHAQRGFCGTCGSVLFWKPNQGAHIAMLAGSFDDPAVLTASMHICVAGRADYYALSDGLPQYDYAAPGVTIAPAP